MDCVITYVEGFGKMKNFFEKRILELPEQEVILKLKVLKKSKNLRMNNNNDTIIQRE